MTTVKQAEGDWTSQTAFLDSVQRVPVAQGAENQYKSEAEARQAALSAAAEAIDRTRISKGKP